MVNKHNRKEFVELLIDWHLNKSVEKAFDVRAFGLWLCICAARMRPIDGSDTWYFTVGVRAQRSACGKRLCAYGTPTFASV